MRQQYFPIAIDQRNVELIEVTIAEDAIDEPDEDVVVNLTGTPDNASLGSATHTLTILADATDPPAVVEWAQNTSNRRSAVPDAIATSAGYAISQTKRKLIEQGFGWAKLIGNIRQVMVRGLAKVDQMFMLNMTAYNLDRMRTLGQVCLQGGETT